MHVCMYSVYMYACIYVCMVLTNGIPVCIVCQCMHIMYARKEIFVTYICNVSNVSNICVCMVYINVESNVSMRLMLVL